MVQKDQNRNEWKMPLELFGSFVRETTIVDSSREDKKRVSPWSSFGTYFKI